MTTTMCSYIDDLRQAVEAAGFCAIPNAPEYSPGLICAQKKHSNGLCGTGFWIAFNGEAWYVGSYAYRWWRVSPTTDVSALCKEWLRWPAKSVVPPEDLVAKFALQEISDADLRMAFADSLIRGVLRRIHDAQQRYFSSAREYAHGLDDLASVYPESPWMWLPESVPSISARTAPDGQVL